VAIGNKSRLQLTGLAADKVKDVAIGGQRQAFFARIAAIFRASKPASAPAVIGNDTADNESYIVVNCVAFVKGG
jgi:hypothetical protein